MSEANPPAESGAAAGQAGGADLTDRLAASARTLQRWPWLDTLRVLRQRFSDDRLGLTAGSLTFTTLVALVPLLTVMLAVFSAFPMFSAFHEALEKYFLQNLVPDQIARPVMSALTRFASKAAQVGAVGLGILGVTALALMMTIDATLNGIWRVARPRPFAQRLLVYWAALTLGPLLLGASLALTSWAVSASRGLVSALPGGVSVALDIVQFALLAVGTAGLYHHVPNTHVRWAHALGGGFFVAGAFELAKLGLAWYLQAVPTFASVYGAFAVVPIMLLWIYLVWVIVLLGAVIAAYAPSLSMRIVLRPPAPGRRFELALAMLSVLESARHTKPHGLTSWRLARRLREDPLQVEPLLELMGTLGWVARIDEDGAQRWVLLADPAITRIEPLVDALLLGRTEPLRAFREHSGWKAMTLRQALG